jgi:hypothetical protein
MRLVGHESGVLQQAKVARDGRLADPHPRGDLGDGLRPAAELLDDRLAIGIAEGVERIGLRPGSNNREVIITEKL